MACIRGLLQRKGYDERTVELAAQPQRDSSASVYDSHWNRFETFCENQGWVAREANSAQVAQYLTFLFDEGLCPNTIQVHRASITSVLSLTSYDPSEDDVLRRLVKRFHRERPRLARSVPDWDLGLVLGQLMKPPYVQGDPPSDRNIPLKLLLQKTVFLVTLAAGARRSEIHALVRSYPGLSITKNRQSGEKIMSVRPYEGFVAKNQAPDMVFEPFHIPSMAHLVPGELERFLCPVRATELYLKRTSDAQFLKGRTRLFVHHDANILTTRQSHISQWIVDLIVNTYKHADEEVQRLNRVAAHEVRALAQSLAFFNNVSMAEVLQGARWRSRGTFVAHYLRDMSSQLGDIYRLAPVVVAQRIIRP